MSRVSVGCHLRGSCTWGRGCWGCGSSDLHSAPGSNQRWGGGIGEVSELGGLTGLCPGVALGVAGGSGGLPHCCWWSLHGSPLGRGQCAQHTQPLGHRCCSLLPVLLPPAVPLCSQPVPLALPGVREGCSWLCA